MGSRETASAAIAPAIEPLYSLQQAAKVLGIARSSLYRLLDAGEIPVVEIGGRRMIEPAALRDYIVTRRRRREPTRAP